MQFRQEEGETVFVPAGWHHAVLNLTATVCVTQNFAAPRDYLAVAKALYSDTKTTNDFTSEYSEDDEEGCSNGEEVDRWRVKVTANENFSEIHDLMREHCVHCGLHASGNTCPLLSDRVVCKPCQIQYDATYHLVTAADVENLCGLELSKLDPSETPKSFTREVDGKIIEYFLASAVAELVRDEFTTDEANFILKRLYL